MHARRALFAPRRMAGGFCVRAAGEGTNTVMITEITEEMLAGIRTRFVRDRLEGTSFAARGSVGDLIFFWESMAAHGGPHGFAGGMFYGQFEQRYPVECRCVRAELKDGTYTDPRAYRALLRAHAGEERQRQEAVARARETQRGALRDAWVPAGGRL